MLTRDPLQIVPEEDECDVIKQVELYGKIKLSRITQKENRIYKSKKINNYIFITLIFSLFIYLCFKEYIIKKKNVLFISKTLTMHHHYEILRIVAIYFSVLIQHYLFFSITLILYPCLSFLNINS